MSTHTQNLDHSELAKFESMAEDWWNPKGQLRTLHAINPVRLSYLSQQTNLAGKRILDIGCGGGLLCEAMAKQKANVTGIDASEQAITIAKQHKNNLTIEYHHCLLEEFDKTQHKQFDIITCMELLEHVPGPAALLAEAAKFLKPGGSIFLGTINRNPLSYLGAVIAAEYVLKLLPRGTHDYSKFIRPSELCQWLRQNGFKIEDISGWQYIPGLNTAVLSKNPSINYLLHAKPGE